MQTNSIFEFGAVCLAYYGVTASWRRTIPGAVGGRTYSPSLIINSASTTEEGMHEPAASVTVGGRDALLSLRGAIDEALKYESTGS